MRFKFLFVTFLIAGFVNIGGMSPVQAGELKVSGFADIITTLMDEASDDAGLDSDGASANSTELKTTVDGEIDFEYTEGPATFRMDIDDLSGTFRIEQANFSLDIVHGKDLGLSLTAGRFNAPIGFELQDAPDLFQTSHGQLFDLVPANLTGLMLSAGMPMVSLDLYFVDEWRSTDAGAPLGEENSYGGLLTLTPIGAVSLAIGYITSPEITGGAATTDENILDVVLTGTATVMQEIDLMGAIEFLTDENNSAYALVLNVMHKSANHPHGLTLRYDTVDCDVGSAYVGCAGITEDASPTSLTVALIVELASNVAALLEWRTNDPDTTAGSSDVATLEFVTTF